MVWLFLFLNEGVGFEVELKRRGHQAPKIMMIEVESDPKCDIELTDSLCCSSQILTVSCESLFSVEKRISYLK